MAFDAKTGMLKWKTSLVEADGLNPQGFFHGSPVAATIGPSPVIVLGNSTIIRASDGKVLSTDPKMGDQAIASPVAEQGRLPDTDPEFRISHA